MGIRIIKPTTPGNRFATRSDFAEITKSTPEKSLTKALKRYKIYNELKEINSLELCEENYNFKELKKCARYIESNKTILRHLDVKSMVSFICYVNKNDYISDSFKIKVSFII